ncbi:hypothetical protein [Mycobacterium kyogaense]|uniref:hypothetical protein n=1 Tax=Mycobacterium kyogaense TaxID=2212479 RepID=UPI000DAD272C|nr:hypothetical protein [Mycobacterium kyogaense]
MSILDQFLESLAGIPDLPGARCRGEHALFDAGRSHETADTLRDRHGQALAICARCPALDACGQWVDSLPKSQRPHGVIAGRRYVIVDGRVLDVAARGQHG